MSACIFDLDGTLLDSLADLGNACNGMLKARRYAAHPLDVYRTFVGDGLDMLVRRALPPKAKEHTNASLMAAAVAQVRAVYGEHWHDASRPYPDIEVTLRALASRGVQLAVLSNKPHAWTVDIIRYFFPQIPFAVVRGAMDGVPRKPDAGAMAPVLDALGVPAEACVYVGDSNVDVQTAQHAGMPCIGVTWGFRGEDELRAAGATYIVHTPLDIIAVM